MTTLNHLTISLFICGQLVGTLPLLAQTDGVAKPAKTKTDRPVPVKPLFATDQVLSLTLTARMKPLMSNRTPLKKGEEGTNYPALLTVTTDSAGQAQLPVQLRVRGNFRLSTANCDFPPLYLTIPKQAGKGTPFAKQSALKLVTHCANPHYVVREYLAYRIYNLLTDLSYRTRLAQVTYADSTKKQSVITRWGMLIEDMGDVAKRNRAVTYKNRYRAEHCDTLTMATLSVFEYLIGNTDWSVAYRHNIRLVTDSTHKRPMPIPYDFDHSGLVDADYAKPAEQLELTSNRQRLYRGPIYPLSVLNGVINRFNEVKPQIYALYEPGPLIDKGYARQTTGFLDEFYTLINDPNKVRSVFQDPEGRGVHIKGLNR